MQYAGKLENLEREKRKVLEDLAAWPKNQLEYRAAGGSWSALEVIDHLIRVERCTLDDIVTNLRARTPVPLGDRMRGLLVIAVMQSQMKVKVPRGVEQVIPQAATDLAALSAEWNEVRKKLRELAKSVPGADCTCGVLRHPVGGWMTLPRTLAFLAAHIRHHRYQIERIRESAASTLQGIPRKARRNSIYPFNRTTWK